MRCKSVVPDHTYLEHKPRIADAVAVAIANESRGEYDAFLLGSSRSMNFWSGNGSGREAADDGSQQRLEARKLPQVDWCRADDLHNFQRCRSFRGLCIASFRSSQARCNCRVLAE